MILIPVLILLLVLGLVKARSCSQKHAEMIIYYSKETHSAKYLSVVVLAIITFSLVIGFSFFHRPLLLVDPNFQYLVLDLLIFSRTLFHPHPEWHRLLAFFGTAQLLFSATLVLLLGFQFL